MKVAHIVSTFPPYKGGIGNSAFHLSWELSNLGDRVTVFTARSKATTSGFDERFPFAVKRLMPVARYGNAAFVPQLLWDLNNFDIVHLHYPFFGGAEMLYFRDRVKPLNIILHYHMDVVGTGLLRRFFAWHSTHVLPRIIQRANKIIVTSMDYAKQSLIHDALARDSRKFVAIPLGVNPSVFKPRIRDKMLLAKHDLHGKKVILFVGGLDRAHYFKGVNYLIQAFHMISSNDDYRLLIVGDGDLRRSYESLAGNFGLERKVIFTGHVPDDLLPLYYNIADVFVLSSVDSSEAFGIAALEAMASGIPVIASDLPGVRTVVVKNKTGLLFKPKAVGVLAQHIQHLLRNPHISNQLGAEGRSRVLASYTWEIIGRTVHALYEKYLTS